MSKTETAWAGGFFEGEGYISRTSGSSRRGIKLGIGNTDLSSLERFQRAVGTGRITGPYRHGSNQPMFAWTCSRKGGWLDILATLWPYLSVRRQTRALELIGEYGSTAVRQYTEMQEEA